MGTIQDAAEGLLEASKQAGIVYADVKANINAMQDRFIEERKIVTSHVFPPIPDRRYDWCAYYDATEESGNYGWGRTKYDAVLDLINNYDRPE